MNKNKKKSYLKNKAFVLMSVSWGEKWNEIKELNVKYYKNEPSYKLDNSVECQL